MGEERQEIVTDDDLFSIYAKDEEMFSITKAAKQFVQEQYECTCKFFVLVFYSEILYM